MVTKRKKKIEINKNDNNKMKPFSFDPPGEWGVSGGGGGPGVKF